MNSDGVELGIASLPTVLDSPLLSGLLSHELLPRTVLDDTGSASVPLSMTLEEQLKESQLEEEQRFRKKRDDDDDFQFNPFSLVSQGDSYRGDRSGDNTSVAGTNSNHGSNNVTIDTHNQVREEKDPLTGLRENEAVVNQHQESSSTSSIDSSFAALETLADQEINLPFPVPYPTEAVQDALDQADNPPPIAPEENIPPIFRGYSPPVNDYVKEVVVNEEGEPELVLIEGAELIFEKELFDNVGQAGQQDFTFYWESYDNVLGRIEATIETGGASGMERQYIEGDDSRPSRLVFRGSGDGAQFYGNVIFGTYNRMVVDVVKDSQRVRYLLVDELNPACEPCRAGDVIQELGEVTKSQNLLYIDDGRDSPSSALDFSFNIQYRSDRSTNGLVGSQWNHNNFERLEIQIDGSILHNDGGERKDRYCPEGDGFKAPAQFFTSLVKNDDGTFNLRDADGTDKTFDANGNLTEIRDRNDNFVTLQYDANGRMTKFIDTLGRAIDYQYINDGSVNDGRLDKIVDFIGREVDLTYDGNGDLVEVTSPAVTGTPNGNDFPNGKTTKYTYSSGFGNEDLNHNLLTVTQPNEVAVGGSPSLVYEYGTSGFAFDKVISKTEGGINESGVEAGGTYTYEYELLAPGELTGDPNQPVSRFTETDRNGNITEYEFNPLGYTIAEREFTNRNIRPDEPDYETLYEYNADGRLLLITNPEGNVIPNTFDSQNDSRFAQNNVLVSRQLADARGGDQTQITTLSLYEPIYQQVSLSIDPRGLDENFTPPIPDPSGRSQRERYSTRYLFDYQEGDAATVLPLLAAELGVTEAEVQFLLDQAGVELELGDLNGDGVISTSIAGNVVAMVEPSVVLLEDSNQAGIEGDRLQDVITLYRYNQFGQMTSMVDPEGNVHTYNYFAENDPDGDGTNTAPPADGRVLDTETGGYLKEEIQDAEHLIINGHQPNNGSGAEPTAISTQYEYDEVGNVIAMTDGRGIRTEYVVNELDQVVRTLRAADVPDSGAGNADEPLDLVAFAYIEDVEYDANNNVIKRSIEDRGDTSNTGGFVEYEYIYDILDNLVTETQEVDIDTTLVTQYRYDANENLTLTLSPEGNAFTTLYDERDLTFVTTRGALKATDDTLSAPDGFNSDPDQPYNVRGGITCQCTTYTYDGNRNVIEIVDSDDTDLSPNNNGKIGGTVDEEGDLTRFVYDGYDRRVATIDAVGNRTEVEYDPASNVIAQRVFGPIEGESPEDNDGTDNVLLSEMFYIHDELNRQFQSDYNLFVANGTMTVRTPELTDGTLTPDDGKVTMRTEYDRKSRVTFTIEDDEDPTTPENEGTSRFDYDGADRQIKTTDAEGNMVEFAYDDNNNLIETKETDVAQIAGVADEVFLTTYFYDSLNRLQQTVDNIGQTMFYRYDSRDNLVAMADAQGPVTGETINRRAFSEGALTVNAINDFGNVTRYFYDGINRQIRDEQILTASGEGDGIHIGANIFGIKNAAGEEESFTPTPDVNQGGGDGIIRMGYVYDDNSLLSALLDDQGNVTVYLYDNLNRQVTETKGLTVETDLDKDLILGDREIVTPTAATINDPDVIAEELINNQLDQVEAGLANTASLFPSLADQVDDDPPTTIVYGYSPDDNVLILEDENDSETFTKYDAINRAIAIRVFRSGQNDDFTGDLKFAPNPVSDPSNPSDTFPAVVGTNINNYEYDGLSRLTLATDNNDPDEIDDDSEVTFAYDSLSRVIEETQQIGNLPVQAISSGYEADTRSSVTYPNGRKLNYTYDSLDRLKSITDDGEALAIVEYDYIGVGRVLERRSPTNGTRMTYLNDAGDMDIGYDGLRRTVSLRHLEDDDTLIVGFEYGYDQMNNRTFQGKLHDLGNSELYEYDSVYRLINFERGTLNAQGDTIITPSTEVSQGQEWNLDGVGNWDESTIIDENGNPIVDNREHSSFNELVTQEGATLRYDDNGNLVEDAEYTYQYDSRNRLRIATRKADGVVAEYFYDALGRRIRKDVSNSGANDGVTDFYYDGQRVVEERDGNNVLTQQYVYGNYIDEVLVLDRNEDGDDSAIGIDDQRFHYHQDALFSVYAVTDETGQILESYLYDPYGKVTVFDENSDFVADNPWGTANSLIDNPYLFTGRRFDEKTGLYYFRARYYDADQGRFISRDPLGTWTDGFNFGNTYLYVSNNPMIAFDPLGLRTVRLIGGVEDPEDFRIRAHLEIQITNAGKTKEVQFFCDQTKEIISKKMESRKAFVEGSAEGGVAGIGSGKIGGKYKMKTGEDASQVFSLVKREQAFSKGDEECYSCRWDFVSGQTKRYYEDQNGEIYVGGKYKLVKGQVNLAAGVSWQSGITQQRTGYIKITGCCTTIGHNQINIEYAGVAATGQSSSGNIRTQEDIWNDQMHQNELLYRYLRMMEFV